MSIKKTLDCVSEALTPNTNIPTRPGTRALFLAVAKEAEACLRQTDWENRIHRIENILSVIKWRMRRFREEQHESDLERLVLNENKESDNHVVQED